MEMYEYLLSSKYIGYALFSAKDCFFLCEVSVIQMIKNYTVLCLYSN